MEKYLLPTSGLEEHELLFEAVLKCAAHGILIKKEVAMHLVEILSNGQEHNEIRRTGSIN